MDPEDVGEAGFLVTGPPHRRPGEKQHIDGDQPLAEWRPVRPGALRPIVADDPHRGGEDAHGEGGDPGGAEEAGGDFQEEAGGGERAEGGEDEGLGQEMAAEEDGVEEEGRKAVGIKGPKRVSKEEREEHNKTHLPYRSWCEICVKARGRKRQHRRMEKESDQLEAVPRVSMDYLFMTEEDRLASKNPIIVMTDESTGMKCSRLLTKKGIGQDGENDWFILEACAELKSWGHAGGEGGHIILKADGEPALCALRDAIARLHGGQVVPEQSARGESQSNSMAEQSNQVIGEFVRVFKLQIDENTSLKLDQTFNIYSWMIRWAGMLISRFSVGLDGRTAYERLRGRLCKVPVVPFGEYVIYKEMREGKARKSKIEVEDRDGVFLGHARNSNEVLIGTSSGVVRAYSMRRRAEGRRWNSQAITDMMGVPSRPDPGRPGIRIPIRVSRPSPSASRPALEEEEEDLESSKRRTKITKGMLEVYGYTAECPGCAHRRGNLKYNKPHSEACRTRIIQEIMSDDSNFGRRMQERIRGEIERFGQDTEEFDHIVDQDAGAQAEEEDKEDLFAEPLSPDLDSGARHATSSMGAPVPRSEHDALFDDVMNEFDDLFSNEGDDKAPAPGQARASTDAFVDVDMGALIREKIASLELELERRDLLMSMSKVD